MGGDFVVMTVDQGFFNLWYTHLDGTRALLVRAILLLTKTIIGEIKYFVNISTLHDFHCIFFSIDGLCYIMFAK